MSFFYGDSGDDSLVGGQDNDVLYGGDGDDRFVPGAAADLIFDGAGDDTVFGSPGGDNTEFSAGRDVLVYRAGDLIEWIDGFSPAEDRIHIQANLSGLALDSFAEVMARSTEVDGDVVISVGPGANDFIRLFELTKSQLTAANFVFFTTGPAGGFDLPIGL